MGSSTGFYPGFGGGSGLFYCRRIRNFAFVMHQAGLNFNPKL